MGLALDSATLALTPNPNPSHNPAPNPTPNPHQTWLRAKDGRNPAPRVAVVESDPDAGGRAAPRTPLPAHVGFVQACYLPHLLRMTVFITDGTCTSYLLLTTSASCRRYAACCGAPWRRPAPRRAPRERYAVARRRHLERPLTLATPTPLVTPRGVVSRRRRALRRCSRGDL